MGPILHVDMDCFFVACELLERPDLVNKPVAVGGRPEERGVISTANYVARRFGVKSALSSKIALQRCPALVLLNHNFSKYESKAHHIHEIFARHTDRLASVGLDEAYLDLSDKTFDEAAAIARTIKQEILQETRLVASCGLGPNPFLAKVASDWKKPNGFFVIYPEDVGMFLEQLPVRALPGVGEVTESRLHSLGAKTTGDLRRMGEQKLVHHLGSYGEVLFLLSQGIDSRDVFTETARRSLSIEHTYIQDLKTLQEWRTAMADLVQDWKERLSDYRQESEDDRALKNVFIKLKFSDFKSHTLASQIPSNICELENIFAKLIDDAFCKWPNRPVRLLGAGGHFVDEEDDSECSNDVDYEQLELPLNFMSLKQKLIA